MRFSCLCDLSVISVTCLLSVLLQDEQPSDDRGHDEHPAPESRDFRHEAKAAMQFLAVEG